MIFKSPGNVSFERHSFGGTSLSGLSGSLGKPVTDSCELDNVVEVVGDGW